MAPWRFHPPNTIPSSGWIFVFASNEAGKHVRGAARIARTNFRASFGVAEGPTGESYAIAALDRSQRPLPIERIAEGVGRFIAYAATTPQASFFVTPIATGPAGYSDEQIAPLFAQCPGNCSLPEQWRTLINRRPLCE